MCYKRNGSDQENLFSGKPNKAGEWGNQVEKTMDKQVDFIPLRAADTGTRTVAEYKIRSGGYGHYFCRVQYIADHGL